MWWGGGSLSTVASVHSMLHTAAHPTTTSAWAAVGFHGNTVHPGPAAVEARLQKFNKYMFWCLQARFICFTATASQCLYVSSLHFDRHEIRQRRDGWCTMWETNNCVRKREPAERPIKLTFLSVSLSSLASSLHLSIILALTVPSPYFDELCVTHIRH